MDFRCYCIGANGRIFLGVEITADTVEEASAIAKRDHLQTPGCMAVEIWQDSNRLARFERDRPSRLGGRSP